MAAEMFAWPWVARNVGGMDDKLAEDTKPLGWNQGLYNGFLAAGLIWSLSWPPPALNARLAGFFLICVLVAGVFGALTIKPVNRILLVVQALPALLGLLALWLRP